MEDCNVCFELKDLCAYYTCMHKFCKDCCKKWTKNTCPLCREDKKKQILNLTLISDGETDINLAHETHKNIYFDIFRMIHEKNPESRFAGYKYNNDPNNQYFRLRFTIPNLSQKERYISYIIRRYNDSRIDHKMDFSTYDFLNDNLIVGFRKF